MIHSHHIQMFFAMLVAGILSTMNVWTSSIEDIRLSLNDLYMIFLMTGWMFFFMGVFERNLGISLGGLGFALASFAAIRTQLFITERQWILGMIPHHSMAVFMSQKLLERGETSLRGLLQSILQGQKEEIEFMKRYYGKL